MVCLGFLYEPLGGHGLYLGTSGRSYDSSGGLGVVWGIMVGITNLEAHSGGNGGGFNGFVIGFFGAQCSELKLGDALLK